MEEIKTKECKSPFEGVFLSSPEESFPNHLHAQRELSSTPNVPTWPLQTMNLESSEESSKTDSGYCSLTPLSADSLGRVVDKKCHICSSHNYSSTPIIRSARNCTCQKNCSYENQSLHLGYLKPISESRLSPARPNSYLVKQNSTFDFYDDAMDSSLYEADVEQSVPGFSQECIFSSMEIGEEKSIDFTDSGVGLPTTSGVTNTTNTLKKKLSSMEIGEEKSIDFTDSGVGLPTTSGVTNTTNTLKQKLDSKDQENGMDSDEFFSPESNVFVFNVASPKVRNETNSKKVKTCGAFYSVANNIRSINRFLRSFNLNGIDKVDFLYQLGVKKHFPDIISTIFEYLSAKDLDSVRVVSKTWNQLFLSDAKAYKRWDLCITTANMKRENCYSPFKIARGSEGRQTLINITNQNSPNKEDSPRRSPPVSPRSMRFHSYQKAAKNLKKGERLLSCPRCHFPSHDKGSPNVQCSRSGCQHRFCVWCLNETLSETQHNCPPPYTPLSTLSRDCRSRPRGHRIGSKNSKRNLRRLL